MSEDRAKSACQDPDPTKGWSVQIVFYSISLIACSPCRHGDVHDPFPGYADLFQPADGLPSAVACPLTVSVLQGKYVPMLKTKETASLSPHFSPILPHSSLTPQCLLRTVALLVCLAKYSPSICGWQELQDSFTATAIREEVPNPELIFSPASLSPNACPQRS